MDNMSTSSLDEILIGTSIDSLDDYYEKYKESLASEEKPFSAFMRAKLKEKGLKQQDVFIAADIPERYGYKLISEEKHTRQRDTILRLLLASHMSLKEAQTALKLYGMSPLYSKIPRDVLFIMVFNTEIYELSEVDMLLEQYELVPIRPVGEDD